MLFNQKLFSKRIQDAIAERGLSIPKFAAMLGVSKTTVYNWIHGRNGVQPSRLEEAASILNVSSGWLMGFDDKDESFSSNEEKNSTSCRVVKSSNTESAMPSAGFRTHMLPPDHEQPNTGQIQGALRSQSISYPHVQDNLSVAERNQQAQVMIQHIVNELMELKSLILDPSGSPN